MLTAQRTAHGRRDVAASAASADAPIQLGHEIIVEHNV
jgi:hypothetical protein